MGGYGEETHASHRFTVSSAPNKYFGRLVTLAIDNQPMRRLTHEESLILGRALAATAAGMSAEERIYMSPIASDQDFDAIVEKEGLVLISDSGARTRLDWGSVVDLARHLSRMEEAPASSQN